MPERQPFLATCTRGTEDLLAAELTALSATRVRQDRGAVRFVANWREALRVCLRTRLAMRVLMPLHSADTRGAQGLYDAVATVPWEEYLDARSTFAVEATLRGSEHTHSGFVALKVKDAIVDRLRERLGRRPDVDTRNPDVSVVAHLAGAQLSLSLDLAGEALHKRGYRVRTTQAPLKETLAAALLAAAKYEGEEPLVDPMCGSGTLLIEAAGIATRRAPGLSRAFGVERWPHHKAELAPLLRELKEEAKAEERPAPFPIVGSDREPEAVEAAQKNAAAAGLSRQVRVSEADALTRSPPEGPPGLVLSNPPYGDRLTAGGQKGMKTFYFQLGEAFARWKGWRLCFLCGNPAFESAFHARPNARRELWNGPIRCALLGYGPR